MFPILEPKKIVTAIISRRNGHDTDVASEQEAGEETLEPTILKCAEALLHGFQTQSPLKIAHAMKDMFQALESEPHYEYGEGEDYAAE